MGSSKKKNNQVIVNQKCSVIFTFNDGKFITDHEAKLIEVSTHGALITSKYNIDVRAIHHIESAVNGGQGQMIPFAGEVNRVENLSRNNKTCYFMEFNGYSEQAQRYINIHSSKSPGRSSKTLNKNNLSNRRKRKARGNIDE